MCVSRYARRRTHVVCSCQICVSYKEIPEKRKGIVCKVIGQQSSKLTGSIPEGRKLITFTTKIQAMGKGSSSLTCPEKPLQINVDGWQWINHIRKGRGKKWSRGNNVERRCQEVKHCMAQINCSSVWLNTVRKGGKKERKLDISMGQITKQGEWFQSLS